MAILLAFPILSIVLMVQTAMVSRMTLLNGSADLMLLTLAAWALHDRVTTAWHWALLGGMMVGFVSGLPWFVPLLGYLLVVGLARLMQYRIWQVPVLAMFSVSFLGTLAMHFLSFVVLRLVGDPLPLGDSFILVTLPSILLNLLWAMPVYALIRDLAVRLYPSEVEA